MKPLVGNRNRFIIGLFLVFLMSGCTTHTPDVTDYNVLLIVLDTLRADYLSCINPNSVAKTPNIDRLATRGAIFTKAFTTVPLTLPAHASLMTSRYPAQLGIRRNGRNAIPPEETTLAEILQANEFKTGAVISAVPVSSLHGMNQGFDFFGEKFVTLPGSKAEWITNLNSRRSGTEVNEVAFRWLNKSFAGRFFLWVHYYDVHSPFFSIPDEFRFKHPGNPYAGAVEYADKCVGDLLDHLQELGVLEKTLIVLVSDHGEGLGDHGEMGHGIFVYNATTHIPLIMSAKNLVPVASIDDPVSILDVTPTILDLLQINSDADFEGVSLAPLIAGAKGDSERRIYSETIYPLKAFGWSPLYALAGSHYKFIEAPQPEFYRLTDDFAELNNLVDIRRTEAEVYRKELQSLITRQENGSSAGQRAVLDSTAVAQLKSLGYVVGEVKKTDRIYADPKDRIDTYEQYMKAMRLVGTQEYQKATQILRGLILHEKNNPVFLSYLGLSLFKQQEYAEAEEVLKDTLNLDSDYFFAVQTLAQVYEERQEYKKAIDLYQKYISRNPDTISYQYELWNLYVRIGQGGRALAEMETTLKTHPDDMNLQLKMAGLLMERQGYQEALKLYQQLLNSESLSFDAQEGAAKALLFLGRYREAEKAYLKVVQLEPGSAEAHLNLGMIYSKLGRIAEGVASCRHALKLQPDNAVIQFDVSYLLLLNGRMEEAKNGFDRALQLDPSNWKVHLVLGLYFKEQGRLEEARAEFEKGLRIIPKDERFDRELKEVQKLILEKRDHS